ncbi:MAG TPA: hypothetical protein VG497_30315 [Kribbella sp.]|nr:hypothetical protein [Kribbella sp.]
MVGRFNAREGAGGDTGWTVFDNAANGNRGSGLSEDAAYRLAADLELQYDVYGPRNPDHVRRVDPPVPVEKAWVPVGFVDAWVFEQGTWIGRVKDHNGRYTWIPGIELRQAELF